MVIIFDIDLTLADAKARVSAAGNMPERTSKEFATWLDNVHAGMQNDRTVPELVTALKTLEADHEIVYITAREDKHRIATRSWLASKGLPVAPLYMRDTGDRRTTQEYKREKVQLVKELNEVVGGLVIDDDLEADCSSMYLEEGFVHLKVFYK